MWKGGAGAGRRDMRLNEGAEEAFSAGPNPLWARVGSHDEGSRGGWHAAGRGLIELIELIEQMKQERVGLSGP